jgi:tRNA(fMet)-specific endonuclease VapC
MQYLLDTDICIYLLKRKPPQVISRFRQQAAGSVGVSTVTVAELHYGAVKSQQPERNLQALENFLLPLEICAFDLAASASYGQVRAELERAGNPIGPLDTMIAGHALSLSVILVTNNVSEFQKVAGLQIDNWAEAGG